MRVKRPAKAVDDFKRVPDSRANGYPMLLLYLSRARAGQKDPKPDLAKSIERLKPSDWPYPIAEFYLGRKSPQAAEAPAADPGQKCEAQFYIGELQLTRGARTLARKALQTVADTCAKDFVEYRAAVEELKRMK